MKKQKPCPDTLGLCLPPLIIFSSWPRNRLTRGLHVSPICPNGTLHPDDGAHTVQQEPQGEASNRHARCPAQNETQFTSNTLHYQFTNTDDRFGLFSLKASHVYQPIQTVSLVFCRPYFSLINAGFSCGVSNVVKCQWPEIILGPYYYYAASAFALCDAGRQAGPSPPLHYSLWTSCVMAWITSTVSLFFIICFVISNVSYFVFIFGVC